MRELDEVVAEIERNGWKVAASRFYLNDSVIAEIESSENPVEKLVKSMSLIMWNNVLRDIGSDLCINIGIDGCAVVPTVVTLAKVSMSNKQIQNSQDQSQQNFCIIPSEKQKSQYLEDQTEEQFSFDKLFVREHGKAFDEEINQHCLKIQSIEQNASDIEKSSEKGKFFSNAQSSSQLTKTDDLNKDLKGQNGQQNFFNIPSVKQGAHCEVKDQNEWHDSSKMHSVKEHSNGFTKKGEHQQEATLVDSNQLNIINEISENLSEWKRFARILDFTEPEIKNLEEITQQAVSALNTAGKLDVFEISTKRNKDLIQIYLRRNPKINPNSWKFWSSQLKKFTEGEGIIRKTERYFPHLIAETSVKLYHKTTSSRMTYIGHPLQYEYFQIDKNNAEICVNLGSADHEILDLQNHSTWLETQERYIEVFSLFNEKIVFNFYDLEEYCPILNTFEQFIKETGDKGFAMKGYHFWDHIKLYQCFSDKKENLMHPDIFDDSFTYEHYFLFLQKKNLAIYFTKCGKEVGHGLHFSSQKIRIMNALHEEFQSKDLIQVNVHVHNHDEEVYICNQCMTGNLFISEETLLKIEKFKLWIELFQKSSDHQPTNLSTLKSIKRSIITHEALKDGSAIYPSFSLCGKDQMNEMPKIIFLTEVQFKLLHTRHPHLIITGAYGSGKSIVLMRKLEKCIESEKNEETIIYYICHDQQTELISSMENIKLKYPKANIVVCSTSDLLKYCAKPTLSSILNHIHCIWENWNVHIFVEEFNGTYFDLIEIKELKKILPKFANSQIVIALQTMEEHASDYDLGYQYDNLAENTSFIIYNLEYSLRCSVQINDFIRFTASFLEQNKVSISSQKHFFDSVSQKIVDKQYGQEKNAIQVIDLCFTKTFSYNVTSKYGHFAENEKVSIYIYDQFNKWTKLFSKKTDIILQFYISLLEYILTGNGKDKDKDGTCVICTFDEQLYNCVSYYLEQKNSNNWTNSIATFQEKYPLYKILLTDYASIRGHEFTSELIFLLRMGTKHLKYRIVECCTRPITKLHIVADNVNVNDRSSLENKLINLWKKLSCVEYFDCKYEQSKNTLRILRKGDLKYEKKDLSSVLIGALNRFPWYQPRNVEERVEQTQVKNDLYDTILYLCKNDNFHIFHEFIRIKEIDILTYCGPSKESLLHISSHMGGFKIIENLIKDWDIDVSCQDNNGRTPLFYAARNGHVNVVTLLIDENANINAEDHNKKTALHLAVWDGHLEVIGFLLGKRADINAKDENSETALHLAARNNHLNVVKLLVTSKGIKHEKNIDSETPLDIAHTMKFQGVVDIIKDFFF